MTEPATDQGTEHPPSADQQPQTPTSAQQEDNDFLAQLQRERADFRNYRRRATQACADEVERARAQQIQAILPILDDLGRGFSQVPDELRDHPWTRGIALGQTRLLDFLAKSGVEPFGAPGEPFDPVSHEALYFEERPDIDDRRVISVIQPGYRMGERILRPAQVGVAGPSEARDGATNDRRPDDQ
jgi:molecular chaperone GrpE